MERKVLKIDGKEYRLKDVTEIKVMSDEEAGITPEDLAMADEYFSRPEVIARGIELEKEYNKQVGRPALSSKGVKRAGFRLPAELDEALQAKAEAEHKNPSEVIREALKSYLNVA